MYLWVSSQSLDLTPGTAHLKPLLPVYKSSHHEMVAHGTLTVPEMREPFLTVDFNPTNIKKQADSCSVLVTVQAGREYIRHSHSATIDLSEYYGRNIAVQIVVTIAGSIYNESSKLKDFGVTWPSKVQVLRPLAGVVSGQDDRWFLAGDMVIWCADQSTLAALTVNLSLLTYTDYGDRVLDTLTIQYDFHDFRLIEGLAPPALCSTPSSSYSDLSSAE